jgi:hypothetical protein
MSDTLVRARQAAVAVKIETTKGDDAIGGSPAVADFIRGSCDVGFDQTTVPDPQYTGSLDSAPPIVGGLRPRFTIRMALRGSGLAGTAPEWGRLLRCCTMVETTTGTAVGAPTAATAGTTSTITAASPFGTTAQAYRGMPLLIAGTTQDGISQTLITDYTAGRVATILHTASSPFTTGATLQVPVNVLYAPTSDETVYKTATVYLYMDGLLWTFLGCTGSWGIEFSTGGIAYLTFTMTGQFGAKSTAAFPAAAVVHHQPHAAAFRRGCHAAEWCAGARAFLRAVGRGRRGAAGQPRGDRGIRHRHPHRPQFLGQRSIR